MSNDESITKDLVQVAEDGKVGYAKAADELASSDRPELAATFRQFSEQRAGFSAELRKLAGAYGDDVDEGSSAAAALHRGWMHVKDAVTGAGPESVLKTAGGGEEHAIKEYEKALAEEPSIDLRTVVERQLAEIRTAKGTVDALRAQTD